LPSRRRPSNELEHLAAGEVAAMDQGFRYSFDGRLVIGHESAQICQQASDVLVG